MHKRAGFFAISAAAGAMVALAGLGGSYVLPLDHEALQYATRPVDDPVARLEKKLAAGEVQMEFDEHTGYLRSVLRELGVPVESQVLVFSKTSFQATRIAPRTPRALYFNDQVSIGYVRTGDVLEVAAVDPKQGVIFYTLDQDRSMKPHFERRDTCLQCHSTGSTLGVPGLVVRSVFPEPTGMPLFHAGSFVTDHRSPLKERWGGWYVTGTHGDQMHMGNAVVRDRTQPNKLDEANTQNVTELGDRFDTGLFLSPHSDIVALMVLEHQSHMTNLITRVGYEARMALHSQMAINKALGQPEDELSESAERRIRSAVEEMLEYMLFTEETVLTGPIQGSSGFAQQLTAAGPKDKQGRSLRDLDLKTRLFRYPCSFLIYSEAFDGMPAVAQDRLYRRLWEILTERDKSPKYARLSSVDRKAILEILLDTKKDLPDYWSNSPEDAT
jgi:hypothetical protein